MPTLSIEAAVSQLVEEALAAAIPAIEERITAKVTKRLAGEADGNRYMKTPEAAAFLSLSPTTLEIMRCKGGGPLFSKGEGSQGAIRYKKSDLIAWAEGRKRKNLQGINGARGGR